MQLSTSLSIFLFLSSISFAAPAPDNQPQPNPDANGANSYDGILPHSHNPSPLDNLCQQISMLENLVHQLNSTTYTTTAATTGTAEPTTPPSPEPHPPNLNVTSSPMDPTAHLRNLTANATLAGLCQMAAQVEHDCSPLAGLIWANMTHDGGDGGPDNSTAMDGGRGPSTDGGPGMGMMPNITAGAQPLTNATLVDMCVAFVMGMARGNMSETDAALAALQNVSSRSTSGSTAGSGLSADSSSTTGSSSAAVQAATLSRCLGACVVILAGMMVLG